MSHEPREADHIAADASVRESDLIDIDIAWQFVLGTWPSFLRNVAMLIVALPIIVVAVGLFALLLIRTLKVADVVHVAPEIAYGVLVFGGALVIALLIPLARAFSRRRLRNRLHAGGSASRMDRLSEVLHDAMKRRWYDGSAVRVYDILQYLLAEGWAGRTLRVCPSDAGMPVDPFAVPFEPLPLRENSPALGNLLRLAPHSGSEQHAGPAQRRRGRRLTPTGLLRIIFVIVAAFVAYALGRRTWPVLLALVVVPVLLRTVLDHTGFAQNFQWLVVPGGLVRRKAGWFRQHWDVQLFDRRQAVLVICLVQRGTWWFAITDGQRHTRGHLSTVDCEALLRAWRSPLTPPAPELLAELH